MFNNLDKLIKMTEKFAKDYKYGGTLNININDHKTCYNTIREHIINAIFSGDSSSIRRDLDEEEIRTIEECEKTGNIYEITLFNLTPVGHYSTFDSSLEGAALKMLEMLERDKYEVIVNIESLKY